VPAPDELVVVALEDGDGEELQAAKSTDPRAALIATKAPRRTRGWRKPR
jgi:hypothetical protein